MKSNKEQIAELVKEMLNESHEAMIKNKFVRLLTYVVKNPAFEKKVKKEVKNIRYFL